MEDLYCPWCNTPQVYICRDIETRGFTPSFWYVCNNQSCNSIGPRKDSREMVVKSLTIPNFYKLIFKDGTTSKIIKLKNYVDTIKVPDVSPARAMTHEAFIATPIEPIKAKTFVKSSHQLVRLFNYTEKD